MLKQVTIAAIFPISSRNRDEIAQAGSNEYSGFPQEKTMRSTIIRIERRHKRQLIAVLLLSLVTAGFRPFTSSAQDAPVISPASTVQPDMVLIWNDYAANS